MSRELAIARSHADAGVAAVLVVAAGDGEWVVHRIAGAAADSATLVVKGSAAVVIDRLPAVTKGVDLVVVDAAASDVRYVQRAVISAIGPARLVVVDPALLHRFGTYLPLPPIVPTIDPFRHRRVRRWPAALVVGVFLVALAVGTVVARPRAEAVAEVIVGHLRVDIPDSWRRTDLAGEPAPRAVFVDPTTGSRIIVAVSPLRRGASLESVAASLAERIRQRGDDAVSEFAVRAQFAGHVVTAYRETPDSGAPIRWYVRVLAIPDRGLVQTSIGCQESGERGLEAACRRAVAHARP